MEKTHSVIRSTIIILLVTLAMILLGELLFRLFGVKPGSYVSNRFAPYDFDPIIGWKIRPLSHYLRVSPEYRHYNYYDKNGFPCREEDMNKELDMRSKVALVGDSFVESYYVPYEVSFPYLLQQKVEEFQILNLGVSGYSPGQYLMQVRDKLKGLDIEKIFVFYHPFNDIRDLNSPTIPPGGIAKPLFGPDLSRPYNLPLKKHEQVKVNNLEDYSAMVTFFQPLLHDWLGYISTHFTYRVTREMVEFSEEKHLDALNYMKQIEIENKVKKSLLVVYIPAEFEYMYDDVLERNVKNFNLACEKLSISCEVPEFFLVSSKAYLDLYLVKDHHLNKMGSSKMAEYLYSILEKD